MALTNASSASADALPASSKPSPALAGLSFRRPTLGDRFVAGTRYLAVSALGPAFPFLLLLVFAVLQAFEYRWICDDAFISFRYALQFTQGHGLVYNVGERVEGYTNFLWVLELGSLHWLTGVSFSVLSLVLSGCYTAGTLALTLLLARSSPLVAMRRFVALVAFAWLCLNRNFALWTTSGLETRQFTFFVILAAWLVLARKPSPMRLAGASFALACAAWTRPEGPLLFGGVLLWYAIEARRVSRFSVAAFSSLVAPFALLVGGHFLFRWAYYGEWLPNTYYAKHVRAWPDMGIHYFTAAVLESGLYLALPLAALGALAERRTGRPSLALLAVCLLLPHAVYLTQIGGDHFEFRPLDFYWPLLAILTAQGLAQIVAIFRIAARRLRLPRPRSLAQAAGVGLTAVFLFHATVLQLGQYALFYDADLDPEHVNASLSARNFPLAHVSPATARLAPLYDRAMELLLRHAVAVRHREHEQFAESQQRDFGPYGREGREPLPSGVVMAYPFAGILPFQFPEVTFIDQLGLTDPVISRNNAPRNRDRAMAHDRRAPPGYLESRGVNLTILAASTSLSQALERGRFAVRLAPDLWMPFEADSPEWVQTTFGARDWYARPDLSSDRARGWAQGRQLRERLRLGSFEQSSDEGWTLSGVQRQTRLPPGQGKVSGQVGAGRLSSFRGGDGAKGVASSPEFEVRNGDVLLFLIAGGDSPLVGVELLVDGAVQATFHGLGSENFSPVYVDLAPYVGSTAVVRLFDRGAGPWEHAMLDQVVVLH